MISHTLKFKNSVSSVVIGNGLIKLIPEIISDNNNNKKFFFIIDQKVYKLHKKNITGLLKVLNSEKSIYLLSAKEKNKSLNEIERISSALVKGKYLKDTTIISIGGGLTGDIAGFAASIFMRGIKHIIIPTTLLAMVDSSIGGKNGVNFGQFKNLIGTITQPHLTVIDTSFLSTLSNKEFLSGFGEILKYSLLDEKLCEKVIQKKEAILNRDVDFETLIADCVEIKAAIVTEDENEKELRKILNLGHTFGHAFESQLNFKISHGDAVTLGLISALYLSHKKDFFDSKTLEKFLNIFKDLPDIKIKSKIIPEDTIKYISLDKKNKSEKSLFYPVLVKGLGEIVVDCPVAKNDLVYAIKLMKKFKTNNAKG